MTVAGCSERGQAARGLRWQRGQLQCMLFVCLVRGFFEKWQVDEMPMKAAGLCARS